MHTTLFFFETIFRSWGGGNGLRSPAIHKKRFTQTVLPLYPSTRLSFLNDFLEHTVSSVALGQKLPRRLSPPLIWEGKK